MKYKTKGLIKKISLVLLGLGVIGGSAVGITKLVDHLNADKESLHLTYEVGGLNAQGRYEEDKSRLYTEESFRCDGLQAKLDFDSTISYQFFYYDDLGNFMEKTEIYTEGESFVPMGTYARCVITPLNDDNKISLKERITYPSQLDIMVSKKQESKSFVFGDKTVISTNNVSNLKFVSGYFKTEDLVFVDDSTNENAVTSLNILDFRKYSKVKVNSVDSSSKLNVHFVCFDEVDGRLKLIDNINVISDEVDYRVLPKDTKFVIIYCVLYEIETTHNKPFTQETLSVLQNYIAVK